MIIKSAHTFLSLHIFKPTGLIEFILMTERERTTSVPATSGLIRCLTPLQGAMIIIKVSTHTTIRCVGSQFMPGRPVRQECILMIWIALYLGAL